MCYFHHNVRGFISDIETISVAIIVFLLFASPNKQNHYNVHNRKTIMYSVAILATFLS